MDWDGVTVGQALRRSARLWPETEFVVGMGERLDYAGFDAKLDKLAAGLLRQSTPLNGKGSPSDGPPRP